MATVLWVEIIWGILLLKLLMPCFTCCCVLACGLGAGIAHLPEAHSRAQRGWWPYWPEIQMLLAKLTSYGKGKGATKKSPVSRIWTFKTNIFWGISLLIVGFLDTPVCLGLTRKASLSFSRHSYVWRSHLWGHFLEIHQFIGSSTSKKVFGPITTEWRFHWKKN